MISLIRILWIIFLHYIGNHVLILSCCFLLSFFCDFFFYSRLDGRDFRNRPGVEDAQPVAELISSDGNALLLGTWVAECILHKKIGAFVLDFKNKAHVMEKMYRARATMKMYAENSPHKDGHNLSLFKKAEKVVHATGALIDEITQKNMQRSGLKILADHKDPESQEIQVAKRSISDPKSIYYNIDAPPIAAFIVFEHSESFARCLRDHTQYAHYPMRWFYPNVLKIKGHKINVKRASEPDQILWENLEITNKQKTYLRIRTALITFVLVIGCFIVVLQASIYKAYFAARVPDDAVCSSTVPLLYSNYSAGVDFNDIALVRPPSTTQNALDAQCVAATGNKGAFFAVYSSSSVVDNHVPAYSDIYDLSACSLESTLDSFDNTQTITTIVNGVTTTLTYYGGRKNGLCPDPRRNRYCPCVSTTEKTDCYSRDCYFPSTSKDSECEAFSASSVGACYCYQELAALVNSGGVIETLNKINSLKSGPCGNFYSQYSLSVGLTYVSVLVTTIVNVLLRIFLKKLAKHEARSNTDEEQGSVMTKIFLSNYATMAIIILVAYGKAKNLPAVLKTLHIFAGVYDDFTPGWYGQVGYFLITTSILQSFSPLVANLFMCYIGKPLLRWYHHARVKALKSHSIVMQHDLNMLEVGPVFDSTDHTAQLLTLLFFSMTFAPGLPLLMPLCCFTFVLYFRVDKLLLCRYYQAPPHIGDATIRLVVHLLPIAAIVRLGFACWMLSCPDTAFGKGAREATGTGVAYKQFLETARGSATNVLNFANDRIFQPHTFPLFVLLLIIAACILLMRIYQEIPIHLLFSRFLDCLNSLTADGHASADARKLAQVARRNNEVAETKSKSRNKHNDYDDSGHHSDDLISLWSLAKLNDPLRQQSAAYTRDYFRYVKHRDEIPNSCYEMFAYAHLTKLSDLDKEQGWQLEERGDFIVRTKVFLDAAKRVDGSRARVGERKKTYEVVADNKCFSYDIEKVPAYATAMRGLREGTTSIIEYKHMSSAGINTGNGSHNYAAAANVYDESDLANSVLNQYQGPVSAQPNYDTHLDATLQSTDRTKPSNSVQRPKTGQQVIPLNIESSPSHGSGASRPGTSAASRPSTSAGTAATSGGTGGNFTFDDFANMDFSGDQITKQNTHANMGNTVSPSHNAGSPHLHSKHGRDSQGHGNNDKIHISKEQKHKRKQRQQQGSEHSDNEP